MKNFLCVLLLIWGCKSERSAEELSTPGTDTAMEALSHTQEVETPETFTEVDVIGQRFQFENDDIGGYPFTKDFESMVRSIRESRILKKPFRNVQDTTQTDTLMTVNFGTSSIEYYKVQADARGFIIGASIESNDVELKNGIRIGMTDREFFALFDELKGKSDLHSVMISTPEGLNQTEFVFIDGKLSTVRYQSYFD
jgi:hypothetical protein